MLKYEGLEEISNKNVSYVFKECINKHLIWIAFWNIVWDAVLRTSSAQSDCKKYIPGVNKLN